MKVVQISSTCGSGSIGKICQSVSELLTSEGIENYVLYTIGHSNYQQSINYGKPKDTKKYALLSRVIGNYGFNATFSTNRLIEELDCISPDIVHIHNIHSHDCNFETLFAYLKDKKIKIYYTFHDCWAFTGYCMYFDAVNCNKWKTTCHNCPQRKKFSWFFDRSKELQQRKKKSLTDLDLTIITPSEWLANLTKESFLSSYPIRVINNGIDLNVFSPTQSDFRKKFNCEAKFVILGIASKWEKRKGLDTFIKLASDLSDQFQIVLVGTTDNIDKKLPQNIISIHRTEGQKELASIYTAADILVNPTMEENFPTVNIEAIACGTPVFTYDTGGSAEMLNERCSVVIPRGDYRQLLSEIQKYSSSQRFSSDDCIAQAAHYAQALKFSEYIDLYKK